MNQVRGMFVLFTFALGVLTPILLTPRLGGQSLVSWPKKEVVPIVIVKPFMGRFVPDDDTSIGI